MVNFGDQLGSLRHSGWEGHYIAYDALKRLIDDITDASGNHGPSKMFFKTNRL